MDVLTQGREGAEQLGQAVLLAALDDLTVTEYILEPGTEPGDPHYHANHTDSFYVIEGELEFNIDGRAIRAQAGMIVVAPRGAVHAFPVAIGSRARFLNLHTPGGFETVSAQAQADARERRETRYRLPGVSRQLQRVAENIAITSSRLRPHRLLRNIRIDGLCFGSWETVAPGRFQPPFGGSLAPTRSERSRNDR